MKLKTCPFCGSNITFGVCYANSSPKCNMIKSVKPICKNKNCFLNLGSDGECHTKEEYYAAWNTRADEPAEEKTAHWDINCDGYYPFCSHCGEAAERMSPHCPNCGAKMITRRHEDA